MAEETGNRVQKFTFTGGWVRKWGSAGTGDGQFSTPIGIAVDRTRNQVYICEYNGDRIQQFTVFGDFIKVFSGTTLDGPLSVATDQHGNIYASDLSNNRIVQFNDNGTYLGNFIWTSANGVAVNPKTAPLFAGTVATGTIGRFAITFGKTDNLGVYRPSTQTFRLRNSQSGGVPDITAIVALALTTDLPVTGDWNGDGIDTPGLYDRAQGFFTCGIDGAI
ncbi:MAG: hypothetical protein ABI411_10225 [Tahibacter sp.]